MCINNYQNYICSKKYIYQNYQIHIYIQNKKREKYFLDKIIFFPRK